MIHLEISTLSGLLHEAKQKWIDKCTQCTFSDGPQPIIWLCMLTLTTYMHISSSSLLDES